VHASVGGAAARPFRRAVSAHATRIDVVNDDFSSLGSRGFERMCQALAAYALDE